MDDKHFVTDGKNLKVWDSTLCIETRSEKAEGKAWHPLLGFVPKQFEYTSGHINTGKSFRQKQGRFRAKIKLSDNKAITHSFCLVGNSMLPQIDIVKYNNGKWYLGNFWGNITEKNGVKKNIDNISASKLCNDYYIFELEWNATSITWKINNLVIKTQNTGIPDEPMYIAISSGIYSDNNAPYPAKIEIDWVKCYTVNE
jgi:beta-glucanase (GH16 family)